MSSPPSRSAGSALTIEVRGGARRRVRAETRRALERRITRALKAAGVPDQELCLSLTDDAELRELNLQWAGKDRPTDVLSFAQAEGAVTPARRGASAPLGDVVISTETARRQAKEGRRSLEDELFHLAVHGIAHLLGYDHASPAEQSSMFAYEAKLRTAAEGRGPVPRVRRPPRPTRAVWKVSAVAEPGSGARAGRASRPAPPRRGPR